MTELQALVQQKEQRTVDHKQRVYLLNNDERRSKFIKDIISMANTPRESSAYIICGVECVDNGDNTVHSITAHPDDAALQELMIDRVSPIPEFLYRPYTLDGKSIGVIEIYPDRRGPFLPTKNFGVLRKGDLYFRRGTRNSEATPEEKKLIYNWMNGQAGHSPTLPRWDEFCRTVGGFSPGRNYVLVALPRLEITEGVWDAIGRVPWSAVVDLDPDSVLFQAVKDELAAHRSVKLVTLDNTHSVNPEASTCWYAASGLSDRPATLTPTPREWHRRHGEPLREFLRLLSKAVVKPTTAIVCSEEVQFVRTICQYLDMYFRESLEFVFAVPDPTLLEDVPDQYDNKYVISISLQAIAEGLRQTLPSTQGRRSVILLPGPHGGTVQLSWDDYLFLEEHMEVLHLDVGLRRDGGAIPKVDFLKGRLVSWYDLNLHSDVDREVTNSLIRQVEHDLSTRTATRINLFHYPGIGGTTVGRRVAWHFHSQNPTVVLKKISPKETATHLRSLFRRAKMPILAIVDSAVATADSVEQLYYLIRTEQLPVVFLNVFRRIGRNEGGDRTLFMEAMRLSERLRFKAVYEEQAPSRSKQLEHLISLDQRFQIPFVYGLTAFEDKYEGLSTFVQNRLQALSPIQTEVLVCLSMAYYYGQQSFPLSLLALPLGVPESREVHIEELVPDDTLGLLVEEAPGLWRPLHSLIALEILQQVLAGFGERETWKYNLSTWALRFIEICSVPTHSASDTVLELLRRVFVVRDSREFLGTESARAQAFSLIIENIPAVAGKQAVLETLVENFPKEPHFLAHLGRFLSTVTKEHDRAIDLIDRAIGQDNDDDHVLHHMKGMFVRAKLYDLLDGMEQPHEDEVRILVSEAADSFSRARELDVNNEHGFISHIQMLLRVIDYGYKRSRAASRKEFLILPESTWYRALLDEAEDLLDGAKRRRLGERHSEYIVRCTNGLNEIYENFSRVLEGWNNLLDRPTVYKPPIRRQVVRALLCRAGRDWDRVDERSIRRIAEIMTENMREEPENDKNVRLWFQAIRRLPNHAVDYAIEQLSYWRARTEALDAAYYLYVLYALKTIQGNISDKPRAEEAIEYCREQAKHNRNRTHSFEWLGTGDRMRALVNTQALEWDKELDFWKNTGVLTLLRGRISRIKGPEAGEIELECGLKAFFVPGKGKSTIEEGRHENYPVTFYLGFSYDGLRAWNVNLVE